MKRAIELVAVALVGTVTGCAHAPTKAGERADLVTESESTLRRMEAKDPGLRRVLDHAEGYVVFPAVGSGGFLVGAGAGKGVLYEHGSHTGFATVEHVGAGAIAGGQRYAELVILNDRDALARLKRGSFDVAANASAVILGYGVAGNATFVRGVAVVIDPLRGIMVNASLDSQRIHVTM